MDSSWPGNRNDPFGPGPAASLLQERRRDQATRLGERALAGFLATIVIVIFVMVGSAAATGGSLLPLREMSVFALASLAVLVAWRWLGSSGKRAVLYVLMLAIPLRTSWLWHRAPEGDPSFPLVFTLAFAPVFLAVLGLTHRPRGVALVGSGFLVLQAIIAFEGASDPRFQGLGASDPRLFFLPLGFFGLFLAYAVRWSALRSDLDVALERSYEYQRRMHTDPLTQVLNRAGVESVMQTLHALHESVTIVFADLDRFKSINDTLGHASGDEALQVAAGVFSRTVRDSDLVARWGGEEFVIVLPALDAAESVAAAERLRVALATDARARTWPLTASFGVARWHPDDALDDAIAAADEALYRAKEGGRNRVEIARAMDGGSG